MIKFLLIIIAFFYILSKVGGFIFRTLFGAAAQQAQQQRTHTKKPSDGNVQIDHAPKNEDKSSKNFKGGDYVDFEEVKD
jgi:fructose-specific component phosphotransferase system IIB-like protein